jgi:hypothetical protein
MHVSIFLGSFLYPNTPEHTQAFKHSNRYFHSINQSTTENGGTDLVSRHRSQKNPLPNPLFSNMFITQGS